MEAPMSEDLTAKQRDAALQQWRSLIMRECRDLDSLERISARALQDRDIRADAQLLSMVQAELERRRAELQREQQSEQRAQPSSRPPPKYRSSASRPDESGWRTSHDDYPEYRPGARPAPPDPTPPPPDPDQVAYRQLVEDLGEALKGGDEDAARTVCTQLRTLHARRNEIVSAADLERYEQRIEKLRARLEEFRGQIDTMVREALAAARRGDAEAAAKLMRRLSAIHVAHPRLLDKPGLERIRQDIAGANEGHEDRLTTRRLIECERAVAAKMKRLAAAVNDFHCIVCTVPETSAEFRRAEEVYLQVLQEVRLHEEDWLAEFVLEFADMLAEWSVPPPGAEQQIDRFLEKVRVGIERIHKKMGEIDSERGSAKGW
jgi:hypothetical protein